MALQKTKIVLDADVIIHFVKGECLTKLFDIFPEYQYLILDVVYEELSKSQRTKRMIDNLAAFLPKKLQMVKFNPHGAMLKEYALLIRSLGRGECACMVYCNANKDVLGSSNLRDIKDYCTKHGITYLTTLDFLYFAFIRKLMTKEDCNAFIQSVIAKGSKLPKVDISKYHCNVMI
jgi:rRNA-processing protein FCF1